MTDNAGNAEGIGSRYFTVLNGGSSSTLSPPAVTGAPSDLQGQVRESAPAAGESTGQQVSSLDWVPVVDQPAYVQKGFGAGAPLEIADAGPVGGAARVKTEELGLVRVTLGPAVSADQDSYEGYLVKGSELAALPAGSFLDRKTGRVLLAAGSGLRRVLRVRVHPQRERREDQVAADSDDRRTAAR